MIENCVCLSPCPPLRLPSGLRPRLQPARRHISSPNNNFTPSTTAYRDLTASQSLPPRFPNNSSNSNHSNNKQHRANVPPPHSRVIHHDGRVNEPGGGTMEGDPGSMPPPVESTPKKKGRTNTPWTAEEEQRLKTMRDAGRSWSEIAKTFPTRTEGSVKKHWYKDMHYAEFAEDESIKLREAIKDYEANKWKVIGQKVGKPAKACEQYAKEHFKNL
ncbi:hypothetical protein N7509_009305 [Penicillium cosmopolitanum]|uniref:Myb-like domain-containing protein n=1 Tax=Penicillium cosmopolitanum TaxID=1131564 RepID=A0A9X0B3G8_9EURO|nr:uncharacterized protein N7509_009305 [Penicillium cosmopolitanum]KAJ5386764.1 hypothetical protein N7509_009305 [Penicillium cosmopolitanum]